MLVLLRHSSCSLLIKLFDSEMHQTTAYIIFSEPLHLCMRKKNFCLSIFRVVCNCFHDIYFTCMKNNLSYIYSSLNVPLFQTNISHSQIQIKNIHVLNLYKRAYFKIKIRPNMNWLKIKAQPSMSNLSVICLQGLPVVVYGSLLNR